MSTISYFITVHSWWLFVIIFLDGLWLIHYGPWLMFTLVVSLPYIFLYHFFLTHSTTRRCASTVYISLSSLWTHSDCATTVCISLSHLWALPLLYHFSVRFHRPLFVYWDGHVEWYPGGIISASCSLDMTYFPFDKQRCSIYVSF